MEAAYVDDDAHLLRQVRCEHPDHLGRTVHAGDAVALFGQIAGDGQPRSAADVQDVCARRHETQEPIDPVSFGEALAPCPRPGPGMTPIEADNLVRGAHHEAGMTPQRPCRNGPETEVESGERSLL